MYVISLLWVLNLVYVCTNYTAIDCGTPPTITNGSPGTPTSTTFRGTVIYSCDNGYTLSGSATVTCLASGSWSTTPTCIGNPESLLVNDTRMNGCT